MKKPNHANNLRNILHYAFDDLLQSVWKLFMKRIKQYFCGENRFNAIGS
jgi:hypothetical protein